MTTVLEAASYLLAHCKRGRGHWRLKLGTRGLESLRPKGRVLDLTIPQQGDDASRDGQNNVFLRAAEPELCHETTKEN